MIMTGVIYNTLCGDVVMIMTGVIYNTLCGDVVMIMTGVIYKLSLPHHHKEYCK